MSQTLDRRATADPDVDMPPLADRFDPQDLIATIPPKWRRTGWFWMFGALAAPALVVVNAIQNTLGTVADFQLADDLRRIFGFDGVPGSTPSFPLIRDVPSWLLLITISMGVVLLRHEWNRMAECLPQLVANGALDPKKLQRIGGVLDVTGTYGKTRLIPAWLFRHGTAPERKPQVPLLKETALTVYLGAVQAKARSLRSFVTTVILLTSALLALGLAQWQRHGNLFAKIVPPDMSGAERQQWLDATYVDWWASSDHLLGNWLYIVIAFFAFTVVLSFITGGAYAIYVAAALKHVCQRRASWADEDMDYGWKPLGRVYRTVWQALLLLSLAIAIIVSVLGFTLTSPVGFLFWVGIVSIPLFILLPGVIFHGAVEDARQAEAEPLRQALQILDRQMITSRPSTWTEDALQEALTEVKYQTDRAVLLNQLDRIRTARIKPLRVIPRALFVVLLPQLVVLLGLIFGAIQAFK